MVSSGVLPGLGTVLRPPSRPVAWALGLVACVAGAAVIAVAVTSAALGADLGEPVIAILNAWLIVSYVGGGLVAWRRRPASRFGPLMVAAGVASFLADLAWIAPDALFTVGQALDFLVPVLFMHVFLAFPSGRLHGRLEQALVGGGYLLAVGLQVVRMAFGGFGSGTLVEIVSGPGAGERTTGILLVALSGVSLAAVGVLLLRRRQAGRPLRLSQRLLVGSFALGLVAIAGLFLSHVAGLAVPQVRWATFATLGLAPVAFLAGLLHDRLAQSAVGHLVLELSDDPAPVDLREALVRALRDPSLTLAFWLPDFETFADLDGHQVVLPVGDPGRATTFIDRDGVHVAALLHDPALSDEPALLDAVSAAAGIALDNGRLQAELRARLEELQGSRARIVDAGQNERKRLERDLHDGAQQRLVALSLELGLLEESMATDADARRRLALARREIATSLEELRSVARGLHPAVVSGHGLAVALEQLAARAPVPVRLSVDIGQRLPERLEVAAFYLVSEGLANIGKHADASSASIDVASGNDRLVVEVVDDGVGGARTAAGSGLRGLADRVEALDGRLRVWSPAGGGTRVRAELPCAS